MKWTEEKINILKEGVNAKLTYQEIADILNIDKNPVRLKAQRMGLKSKYSEKLKELSEVKSCNTCHKEFTALISEHRKFCSHSCSTTNSNFKRTKKIYGSFECKNCKEIKVLNRTTRANIYCSYKCHREYEKKETLEKWKSGLHKGFKGKTRAICNWLREYLLEKYNNSCIKCGWNELHPVDHKPLVEINHIDGNAENNKEENLEVLCPNCHSMTYNFRARNKSSTRIRK